jgi:hypothetical protein
MKDQRRFEVSGGQPKPASIVSRWGESLVVIAGCHLSVEGGH